MSIRRVMCLCLGLVALPLSAWAQFLVEDVHVGAQTGIAAANSGRALVQQGIQIANEAKMIQNQLEGLAYDAANLTKSPLQLVQRLGELMGQDEGLLQRVTGLGFDAQGLQGQFGSVYPALGEALDDVQAVTQQVRSWLGELRSASQTAITSQAILPRLRQARALVDSALKQSAAAAGHLAVQQDTNQLLGILAQQQSNAQQTAAASARVQTLMTLTQTELADQAMREANEHVSGMGTMQEVQSIGIPDFR
jgi:P-type conjugative transfer protein TrbJ